ncbi:MAG TPA: hypothetical protein VJA17_02380 [Candidatus Omnitrophota bacterium]|nr:hypothetical protein [Candidatus Omnitrophota bacterium]
MRFVFQFFLAAVFFLSQQGHTYPLETANWYGINQSQPINPGQSYYRIKVELKCSGCNPIDMSFIYKEKKDQNLVVIDEFQGETTQFLLPLNENNQAFINPIENKTLMLTVIDPEGRIKVEETDYQKYLPVHMYPNPPQNK